MAQRVLREYARENSKSDGDGHGCRRSCSDILELRAMGSKKKPAWLKKNCSQILQEEENWDGSRGVIFSLVFFLFKCFIFKRLSALQVMWGYLLMQKYQVLGWFSYKWPRDFSHRYALRNHIWRCLLQNITFSIHGYINAEFLGCYLGLEAA